MRPQTLSLLRSPGTHEPLRRVTEVGPTEASEEVIGCSVVDFAWMNTVQPEVGRAYLFLAEGVFMFLE